MQYILWFDRITKDDGATVGGKGANLGEMTKAKFPVPSGFVVTTKAFEKFLDDTHIREKIQEILQNTDVNNTEQLVEASNKIKSLIIAQDMPMEIKSELAESYDAFSVSGEVPEELRALISAGRTYALVAVRSSATAEDLPSASFAGQQATFLNVKGNKDLADSVKKCWASLYEPRAIFYRAKNNVSSSSIAVVVQRMISSEKSGVMFTINPANGEDNIIVEAVWGLGETIVQGEVEPDHYVVAKDGAFLDKKVGVKDRMRMRDYASDKTVEMPVPKELVNAQVLTDNELAKLAEYGLKLERHYGRSQDVEFAIQKGRIYIVQTRAVTTQSEKRDVKMEGKQLLKGMGASPGVAQGNVKIIKSMDDLNKVEQGDIMVTRMTSPDMVVAMSRSAGIVTNEGGVTSHAAIVSREMGIPAIVGTGSATQLLKDGDIVTLDAYNGVVYEGSVAVAKPHVETVTAKTHTKVKVNLVFPQMLEVAGRADGVGLLRIEHMIAKNGIHPSKLVREGRMEDYIKILVDGIRPIAQAFEGKPVWVRTLDARSDEFRNLEGGEDEPHESNPMIGWHGIRRSLDEPELLEAEFKAIKQLHDEGLANIGVMLPFVISVEEFEKARSIANKVGLYADLGIMVETPAAALYVERFCKHGIKFVSFGSNDLTQMTLAIDRNNERISQLFSEMHPAMKKLFSYVIKVCKKYGVETSICGEGPSNNPKLVEFLIREGIDSLSVEVDALDKVRQQVAGLEG
ncbi:phosphoenolpyruvate synthase [archaeon]|nr:MAG: phosphoenolpyruvate synthase [archaeon]